MYFLDRYGISPNKDACSSYVDTKKNLDDDCVVLAAETSSLDEVAVGLVYDDLLLNMFPFLKGLDIQSKPSLSIKLANGRGIFSDRGNALEDGLKRNTMADLADAMLLDWKNSASSYSRPAAIFNATIVETGERLLFATTDLDDPSYPGRSARRLGRVSFHHLYSGFDVPVVTAVRLSATFPYVSPAARIFQGDVYSPANHVVDGGYFDNFGVVSLVEWLNQALSEIDHNGQKAPPILIVEIRSSPESTGETEGKEPIGELPPGSDQQDERGFFFQALHPATTLWNVRGTGQFSNDQLELKLLEDRWQAKGNICSTYFEFHDTSKDFHHRPEPLSWHLTRDDITELSQAWRRYPSAEKQKVINFIRTGSCTP
jgi:hypothetical protein